MGFFSREISTMDDLFVHTLRDIYYAEKEIVKALPTMIEKATNSELRSGLDRHLAESRNHLRRVEEVFQMHGVEPETVDSPAIDGIIEEADEIAAISTTSRFSTPR
jgi:ferritin-like metal-binding protein YciE